MLSHYCGAGRSSALQLFICINYFIVLVTMIIFLTLLGGYSVQYLSPSYHLVVAAHPCSPASIFFGTWSTVYNNYCSPFLGGYGARTRGVFKHHTLNGIIFCSFYRPTSMPSATVRRCRPSRCGLCGHASPPSRGKCRS